MRLRFFLLIGIIIGLLVFLVRNQIVIGQTDIISSAGFKNGDIVFQTSLSAQSKAIQLATNSPYSHCGLLFKDEKSQQWKVLEAVQPVKYTPIEAWINRGKDKHFVVKRLKADSMLSEELLMKVKKSAEKYIGKDYDLTFEWSDNKIYCSELVWKAYQHSCQISLCKTEKLKDFDLSNEAVKKKLKERYGNKIPLDETVVSPKALYESPILTTVCRR